MNFGIFPIQMTCFIEKVIPQTSLGRNGTYLNTGKKIIHNAMDCQQSSAITTFTKKIDMNVRLTALTAITLTLALTSLGQNKITLEMTVPGTPEYNKFSNTAIKGQFIPNTCIFAIDADTANLPNGTICTKQSIDRILPETSHLNNYSSTKWIDTQNAWLFNYGESAYLVNLESGTVTDSITDYEFDNIDFTPDNKHVAFTVEPNLFVKGINGQVHKINEDSEPGIVYGQAVHRNEFGITKGTFWSNNGNMLAFYRMDERMVKEYPLVDITTREATLAPTRYPMAGDTSHIVQIGIYDTGNQNIVYLKTASPENRYFTNIAWSPDDKYILVAEINREQNHMWLNIYNSADGTLSKTLFEEESNEWVEPEIPAMFVNNNQFAWISERDGYKHIYLYNIDNGKCTQLTNGDWCVCNLYGCNPKSGEIFFQANKQGYLTRDIYKVNTKGKTTRLSEGYGVHTAVFCDTKESFIDNFSAPDYARLSTLRKSTDGSVLDTLKNIKDPYKGYTLPIIKTVTLKSADGKHDLCGRLILPSDFDSTKTYPVIDYMYGGPHSQLVIASWLYGASRWKLYFAQQGYIIFTMDNRGTEYRGVDFEHCIHRQLGKCEMEDQMVGIDYLKSLPYIDTTRIGIHGWSYGGFMTLSMMLNHNTEFKAGVAGGPVCDWSLYEVMYGERYMDTPQDNPDGYSANNVVDKIGNLNGRLLVIHGDIDGTVVWQNSLKLLQNAVNADVLVDYAVYPQHEHNVLGPDRVHLFKRILQYFDDFLK